MKKLKILSCALIALLLVLPLLLQAAPAFALEKGYHAKVTRSICAAEQYQMPVEINELEDETQCPDMRDFLAEVTPDGVQLIWYPDGGEYDGVEIWRATVGETVYALYKSVIEDKFLDKEVEHGKLYVYKTRTYQNPYTILHPRSYGAFSGDQGAAIIDAPTGLKAELIDGGQKMRVSWAKVDEAHGYQLMTYQIYPDTQAILPSEIYLGPETSYVDDDVKPGQTLQYFVRGGIIWSGNNFPGPYTEPVTVTIHTGIKGDADNDGKVDLLDLYSLTTYLVKGTPCRSMDNADADSSGGKPNAQDFVWIVDKLVGK